MDRLGEITREQFVMIHEEPLIDRLAIELDERYGLDFPEQPDLGDLDISLAAKSTYLFG